MEELDRILDRDDVRAPVLVDELHHRRERRGLARSRDAGDEDEAARFQRDLLEHGRQVQLPDRHRLERDRAKRVRDRAALLIHVHAKAADARHADREVGFLFGLEFAALLRRKDLVTHRAKVFRLEGRGLERLQLAVHAHRRRAAHLEVQVGRILLHHLLQDRLVVVRRGLRAGGRRLRRAGGRGRGGRRRARRAGCLVRHWDRSGRGPGRIQPDARRWLQFPSRRPHTRTRSRS